MYEKFYKLTDEPFSLTADPRFFYLSKPHAGALEHLLYGIERKRGLTVLTGENGLGKTTLLHTVMQRFDAKTHTIMLAYSPLAPLDIYTYIFHEFGFDFAHNGHTSGSMLIALKELLTQRINGGESCVLVLDEAQSLSSEIFEELRLLLNFENYQKKYIQIILVGDTQLQAKLNLLESAKLKQRISSIYHLQPLDRAETQGYIERRLIVAGAIEPIFTPDAIAEVHRWSHGVPRLINVLCDATLVMGYNRQQHTLDQAAVQGAEQMLQIQQLETLGASTQARVPIQEPVALEVMSSLVQVPQPDSHANPEPPKPFAGLAQAIDPPSATLPVQSRVQRRGVWRPMLGGVAAGLILISLTWIGLLPRPVRLPQMLRQLGQQPGAEPPSSLQRTTYRPSDVGVASSQSVPKVPEAPQTVSTAQTATVPVSPLLDFMPRANPADTARQTAAVSITPRTTYRAVTGATPLVPPRSDLGDSPSPVQPPGSLPERYVVAQPGDTLEAMILRTYKRFDNQLWMMVQQANPGLTNPLFLEAGQRLLMPSLP